MVLYAIGLGFLIIAIIGFIRYLWGLGLNAGAIRAPAFALFLVAKRDQK